MAMSTPTTHSGRGLDAGRSRSCRGVGSRRPRPAGKAAGATPAPRLAVAVDGACSWEAGGEWEVDGATDRPLPLRRGLTTP